MDRMEKWTAVLLKAAKAINGVTATLCILAVGVGLVVALYFEFSHIGEASSRTGSA